MALRTCVTPDVSPQSAPKRTFTASRVTAIDPRPYQEEKEHQNG
jgi:hypothetical protein